MVKSAAQLRKMLVCLEGKKGRKERKRNRRMGKRTKDNKGKEEMK